MTLLQEQSTLIICNLRLSLVHEVMILLNQSLDLYSTSFIMSGEMKVGLLLSIISHL